MSIDKELKKTRLPGSSTIADRVQENGTTALAHCLSISIGGISCHIVSQDATFLNTLRTRYQWFETSEPATYEILLNLVPFSRLSPDDTGEALQSVVREMSIRGSYIIRQADTPFVAVVNTESKKALVRIWNSQYAFDNFLRIFYSLILVKEGGLLLHASSVIDDGRGRVFFGPSESGKTTVAQLSEGRTVLSDELTMIRAWNGGYRVCGTPFWGEFKPGKSNAQASLGGLYSLKKDTENSIMPADRVQAVMDIYRCVLFFGVEIPLLSRVLETCCAMADSVPVYELHFRKDSSFWQLLK